LSKEANYEWPAILFARNDGRLDAKFDTIVGFYILADAQSGSLDRSIGVALQNRAAGVSACRIGSVAEPGSANVTILSWIHRRALITPRSDAR